MTALCYGVFFGDDNSILAPERVAVVGHFEHTNATELLVLKTIDFTLREAHQKKIHFAFVSSQI